MKGKALALVGALAQVVPSLAVWPLPRQYTAGNNTLRLSSSFAIDTSAISDCPDDLQSATSTTLGYLQTDQLAPLTPDRGASIDVSSSSELGYLVLSLSDGAAVNSIATESVKKIESRSEAYTLTVPSDGSNATLTANSTLGLFRGLTTFSQLWYTSNNQTYAEQVPFQADDEPAYAYRGFMLDTARNYFPLTDIQRTLDAMSWVKLNQFHWHVVDAESFPIVIPGFEELSAAGAYSSSMVYSPDDVSSIISYAAERGIDVMIEIDVPAHTSAIGESHPEFLACKGSWGSDADEQASGQIRIANETAVNYTASMFGALAGMVQGSYVSTGGDEIDEDCYADDAETQAALSASGETIYDALKTFINASHEALEDAGKTPFVWEEMLLDYSLDLSNETVVIVWQSSDDAVNATDAGYRIVQAPSNYFYLDCGAGAAVGDPPLGNSWCDPFKSWQIIYSYEPLANLTSDAQKALVLGGETLLWSEQSDPKNLDPIVWPRTGAVAEVFWTGDTLPETDGGGDRATDGLESALPRLHDLNFRMRQRGISSIQLQPLWCALRPGACDLSA